MDTRQIPEQKIRIEPNCRGRISSSERERMVDIRLAYYPDREFTSKIVGHHIRSADSVRLARDNNDVIVGYSVASSSKQITPFFSRPIPIIYHRLLYLSPEILHRGLGKRLLLATLVDLLGPLWVFRHFACVCRTQNPVVARMMDFYTVSYPHFGEPLPEDVRSFAESLLPMLGAKSLDAQCRLPGTLDAYRGRDFTEVWNQYLQKRNNGYEKLMLGSAFTIENGRIINSGALVLMLAYAKPFQFLRHIFY